MLQINELHAGVENKKILKGVNLEVKPGEIHAIMGPNGSGKSTLSSVISGNENFEVTKGSVKFLMKISLNLVLKNEHTKEFFFRSNIQLKFRESP